MKKILFFMLVGLMAFSVGDKAFATVLPIVNPSFEANVPDDGNWIYYQGNPRRVEGQISDWTVSLPNTNNQGVHRFTIEYNAIPDGLNVAFVNEGYISQVLVNNPVIAGHVYTLEAYVGLRGNNYVSSTRHPSYALELWAGDDLLKRVEGQIPAEDAGGFFAKNLIYPATSNDSGLLEIRLLSFGGQSNFDLVSLTNCNPAQAPIPGSAVLMLSGLLGMSALGVKLRKN
jgi:hypothetical protein